MIFSATLISCILLFSWADAESTHSQNTATNSSELGESMFYGKRIDAKNDTASRALLLSDWSVCSSSSQCTAGCCSSMYSNGILKCTPLGSSFNPTTNGCVSSPIPAPVAPPVAPPTTSKLSDWSACSSSAQCLAGCCSSMFSNGILKCTPLGSGFNPTANGCVGSPVSAPVPAPVTLPVAPPVAPPTTSKLTDWSVCSSSAQCAAGCCSSKYSNGILKCTPFGSSFDPKANGCISSPILAPVPSPIASPMKAPVPAPVPSVPTPSNAFSFVTRNQNTLYEWVNGSPRVFKFTSFNVPDMLYLDPWEQEDLFISAKQMNARAVRTYTLQVRTQKEIWEGGGTEKAIQGSRTYGEVQFIKLDRVLDYAYKHGIRVIIPFIDSWDWFGGVTDFAGYRGLQRNDFFYDGNLKADFKALINKVLTRVNTINGRVYKNDPSVLAWQLGNELFLSDIYRRDPVPVAWTAEMSDYIKSIDNNHLVMDGTWDNNANYNGGDWHCDSGCLKSVQNLDILSVHYYGGDFASTMAKNEVFAYNAGKAFIVDEFGISGTNNAMSLMTAVSASSKTSGSLIWSMRSQSVYGGALTHYEYDGYWAYHWPGYTSGPHCSNGFTQENYDIVSNMKANSFKISDAAGIARPSSFPPCTHVPKIIQASVAGSLNEAFNGCVQTIRHSSFAGGNYRRIDFKIRQATGSWTNILQVSFDGTNFKTVGNAGMTVESNQYLISHYVPASFNSWTTTTMYYRIIGQLSDNQYSTASKVVTVTFYGIDTSFMSNMMSQSNGVNPTPGAPVCP